MISKQERRREMKNPIYTERNENPHGFGMVGRPGAIQSGILWEALVQTSECRVDNENRLLVVARHRYKENAHYLYALALAKLCSEIYPHIIVTGDEELAARYVEAREQMREYYIRFVDEFVKGSLAYSAIKPQFHHIVEAQADERRA